MLCKQLRIDLLIKTIVLKWSYRNYDRRSPKHDVNDTDAASALSIMNSLKAIMICLEITELFKTKRTRCRLMVSKSKANTIK